MDHPSLDSTTTTAATPAHFVPVSIVETGAGTHPEVELANACAVRLRGPLSPRLLRAAIAAAGGLADPQPDEASLSRRRRKGHGRRPIPDHLPREDVLHDVRPEERTCTCGRARARIGEDVSEQLEYIPGKPIVLRHVYPKYACSCCKDGVTSAEPVANPIERGVAAPCLLAYVMVSEYAEHLPLYRQQDVPARHGSFLARSTLCGWMAQCAQHLRPLVELMLERILRSRVIRADETSGAGAGPQAGFDADRLLLGIRRRRRSSLHGVRLP